jgi:hypothetical protein
MTIAQAEEIAEHPLEETAAWLSDIADDPLAFVEGAFPWGGELSKFGGPMEWQRWVLEQIRDGLLRQHVSAERGPRVACPRRRRDAVDCTAAHAVAVPFLANEMGNIVTASGPRPRLRSSRNSVHCSKCFALA